MSELRQHPLPLVVPVPATRPVTVPAATRPPSLGAGLLRTARPRQWVKNLLVFAAPGAAGVLAHPHVLGRAVMAFALFCVAASGTYFLNDTLDRETDRRHPVNRHRPVAAGVIGPPLATAVAAALLTAGLLLAWLALGGAVAAGMAVYVAVNVAYNVRLRDEPVLDLACVASGFVVRAVVGGLATGVHLSEWFLVVTSFASLFIVAGKREATVAALAGAGPAGPVERPARSRPSYPPGYLRFVRGLCAGVAMAAYCLWAFERAGRTGGSGVWLQLTIVPFVLAILRYALLVESGEGGAPEDLLLSDRTMLFLGLAWAAVFAAGVYGP